MSTYIEFVNWLEYRASNTVHRALICLSLSSDNRDAYIKSVCDAYPHTWFIGEPTKNEAHYCTKRFALSEVKSILGLQTNAVIFDACKGVDLNALYGVAGIIKHEGLLVLLLPPQNAVLKGTEHPIKLSFNDDFKRSYFIDKIKQLMLTHNIPHINNEQAFLPLSKTSCHLKTRTSGTEPHLSTYINENELSKAQLAALHAICLDEQATQANIILGDRGRGKTTLLAHIAFSYQLQGKSLSVCTPHKQQFEELNNIYCSLLLHHIKNNTHVSQHKLAATLSFLPPDIAALSPINNSQAMPSKQYLIVDEIASIAPDLVKLLLEKFDVLVLAGTVSGYEGSGKGFVQRLLPFIEDSHCSNTFVLNTPFRWYENDPLEYFFDDLLANQIALEEHAYNTTNNIHATSATHPNASLNITSKHLKDHMPAKISYRWLNKKELLNNHTLYIQICSLLSQAHYQTNPNDLVRILDASDHFILLAQEHGFDNSEKVVAVVVAIIEGGQALAPLATDISRGKRRVQGHLSAQSIGLSLFHAKPVSLRYLRISRIAVTHGYRRLGIGNAMLKACETFAVQKDVDFVSTSFGVNDHLMHFWQQQHFNLVKIGDRVDTASGSISVLLLKPVGSTNHESVIQALQAKMLFDIEYYIFIANNPSELLSARVSSTTLLANLALPSIQANLQNIKASITTSVSNALLQQIITQVTGTEITFKLALSTVYYYLKQDIDKHARELDNFSLYIQKGQHKQQKELYANTILASLTQQISN